MHICPHPRSERLRRDLGSSRFAWRCFPRLRVSLGRCKLALCELFGGKIELTMPSLILLLLLPPPPRSCNLLASSDPLITSSLVSSIFSSVPRIVVSSACVGASRLSQAQIPYPNGHRSDLALGFLLQNSRRQLLHRLCLVQRYHP